jgi:hypothetical protein
MCQIRRTSSVQRSFSSDTEPMNSNVANPRSNALWSRSWARMNPGPAARNSGSKPTLSP